VRWRAKARDGRYQTWRYASLLAFQVAFFLIVNVIAVQALSTQYAWRAWGLYQPFPLFFNVFFWWSDSDSASVMTFFIGAGLIGTFVIIPILAGAFCNYLIPLMIGHDDIAFPTLNMISYWFMWPAFLCIGSSFFAPGNGASYGWTS